LLVLSMRLVRIHVSTADLDSRLSGERPPPPPSVFFAREQLVEEVLNHCVQERKDVDCKGRPQSFVYSKAFYRRPILPQMRRLRLVPRQILRPCCRSGWSNNIPVFPSCVSPFLLVAYAALITRLGQWSPFLESLIEAEVADAIDEMSSCPMVTLLISDHHKDDSTSK
jgi:hypothetical protein